MSDPAILTRLISQLTAKGMSDGEARQVAIGHLEKSGILRKGSPSQLTDRGLVRNAMSPAQRAKDRASSYSGQHPPAAYKYDPKTNLATLKTTVAAKVHPPKRPRSKR